MPPPKSVCCLLFCSRKRFHRVWVSKNHGSGIRTWDFVGEVSTVLRCWSRKVCLLRYTRGEYFVSMEADIQLIPFRPGNSIGTLSLKHWDHNWGQDRKPCATLKARTSLNTEIRGKIGYKGQDRTWRTKKSRATPSQGVGIHLFFCTDKIKGLARSLQISHNPSLFLSSSCPDFGNIPYMEQIPSRQSEQNPWQSADVSQDNKHAPASAADAANKTSKIKPYLSIAVQFALRGRGWKGMVLVRDQTNS